MNVLLLGPASEAIAAVVCTTGDTVSRCDEPFDAAYLKANRIEFAVSYGYRHILREPVLAYLPDRVVNLHISLLPWGRGADPNLWSFLEKTPKGVSIHCVNKGLDTGNLIAQQTMEFDESKETLRSTYEKLNVAIITLFVEHWEQIRSGTCPSCPQKMGGSYHSLKDKERFLSLLTAGWDTPVHKLAGAALGPSRDEQGSG